VISFHPDAVEGVETVFVGREPFDAERGKQLFITRVPEVRRQLDEFRPDAVLGCYLISNGLTASLAWRGPLVVSARGGCVLRQTRSGSPGSPTAARKRMLRFVCSRADRVHAVSDEIAEALERIGIAREKVECFPLGVDASRFGYSARLIRSDQPVRLICIRQQEAVYQNHVVLEAVAELRRRGRLVHCEIVGGGSLLDERRAQARSLGIEDVVKFAGHRPAREMPEILNQAEIYVSASSSDGTSSSLLEAMATGLFPIVSDIRANRVWIRPGENGMLFEPGNVGQLVSAIETAIDQPGLVAAAGLANRQRIETDGDRRVMNGRMLELLDRVCAARAEA
jgi:glycosyltransferase involved in cell wall biosynthesis